MPVDGNKGCGDGLAFKFSVEQMPEARAKLAAMPREKVETVAVQALLDAALFCAVVNELQLAIAEAGNFLREGDQDLAQGCLDDVLATFGKASVPKVGIGAS